LIRTPTVNCEPSPLVWLWVPLFILALSVGCLFLGEDIYRSFVVGEDGILEVCTLLFLATAVYLGVRMVRSMPGEAPAWLRWWILLITLGSIFFLGEEASWGQHVFRWEAGEEWAKLNQQSETNLHNISGFGFIFDQLPRNLLTAAALIGGILIPVYRRIRGLQWDYKESNYWLWPTLICTPVAFIGVSFTKVVKFVSTFSTPPPEWLSFITQGEYKECFLAWFIMLYLLSLYFRLAEINSKSGVNDDDTPGTR